LLISFSSSAEKRDYDLFSKTLSTTQLLFFLSLSDCSGSFSRTACEPPISEALHYDLFLKTLSIAWLFVDFCFVLPPTSAGKKELKSAKPSTITLLPATCTGR
jgi:hypothetical protein